MSVADNMAFGLRNARVPEPEIAARVAEAARVLEISDHVAKKPGQLSGGQRQRVAIGRALVRRPGIFLLDEPLSNLDAELRVAMRAELAALRRRIGGTMIYVTHDQAEAMTLADRIIVMNDRRIQQVGPPMEIYTRPANTFVARFVGSPAMTLAPAELVDGGNGFARVRLGDGSEVDTRVSRAALPAGPLQVGLRPEYVRVAPPDGATTTAKVELVERLGERTLLYARLSDDRPITAEDEGFSQVRVGDRIGLRINGAAAHLFGPDGTGHHAEAAA